MKIHPQVLEKEGKKEFVVLSYEEFLAIKEALEDLEDLKDLGEAKAEAGTDANVKLSDVRGELLSD